MDIGKREREGGASLYRGCIWYARARFGAGGHTFNFARPITKSDMHHSEINSQQRAHVLFVMSRSNSPERGGRREEGDGGEGGGERRSVRKMSPAVVAGSSYLPSELPVNDNPWCPDLPCLSHVYQLSLRALSRIILRPSFVFFVRGDFERFRAYRFNRYGYASLAGSPRVSIHYIFRYKQFNSIIYDYL